MTVSPPPKKAFGSRRVVSTSCCAAAFLTLLGTARAAPAAADGVYGRFGGNIDWSVKVGGLYDTRGIGASGGFSLHYFSLVGVNGDLSSSRDGEAGAPRTSVSLGLELRPLFLPRWALGHQRGPEWLDLALDSVALGFGGYFGLLGEEPHRPRGFTVSTGAGLPLSPSASGPWLEVRAFRRFPDASPGTFRSHNGLFLYLGWHDFAQLGGRS